MNKLGSPAELDEFWESLLDRMTPEERAAYEERGARNRERFRNHRRTPRILSDGTLEKSCVELEAEVARLTTEKRFSYAEGFVQGMAEYAFEMMGGKTPEELAERIALILRRLKERRAEVDADGTENT
jgi:hypothetical protein